MDEEQTKSRGLYERPLNGEPDAKVLDLPLSDAFCIT